MKSFTAIIVGFLIAALFLPAYAQPETSVAPREPGLFVNITTDDTWAVAKAIHFAHDKVLKSGRGPVTIWLNVRGVTLADRNVPSHTHGLTGKSVQQSLQEFVADGGTVIACRACAQAVGMTEDDLIDGVVMGQTDMVLDALFEQNVRTLTW